MSKYVKNLISEHLHHRFKDVDQALLVNVVGLDANADNRLRAELRRQNIQLMVVKNSLAARATAGTPLEEMFEGLDGSSAVLWGGEDIVHLAREVARLAKVDLYPAFRARGGVLEGRKLSAEKVLEISRWPRREELLSLVAGQLLGVASEVVSQLVGPATQIASQIEKLIEDKGGDGQEAAGGAFAGPMPGAGGAEAAPERKP
jgi:large subunit ribosomal protein L10